MPPAWTSFYALLGTASAGLIGLLFVVMSLTAGRDRDMMLTGARVYLTPVVLHFAVLVAVSAIAVAPLPTNLAAVLIGVAATLGFLSAIRSGWRMRRMSGRSDAHLHWSDFWLYAATPAALHVLAVAGAIALWVRAPLAPMAIAGLLLVLLMVCIRNAWDLVTSLAPGRAAAS